MNDAAVPDQAALAQLGAVVRARLEANSAVHKAPIDYAEIFAIVDFLSGEECDRLIEAIDRSARPSTLYSSTFKEGFRTSYSGHMDRNDSFVQMIDRRIADTLGIDPAWGERVQGQRYHPGQEFQAHHDFFHVGTDYWEQEIKRGGQRSWTAMAYLNDVEEGGITEFTGYGARMAPRRGMLLIWNNAMIDGRPNFDTQHASLPVVKGVKYVATKWFRTRPWT
jgi:prolyl 4-hydroxylase